MRKKIELQEEEKAKSKTKVREDDEFQWSIKRIAIFFSILGIIVFIIYSVLTARFGEVLGENDMSSSSGPQITLPSKDNIDDILKDAEDNVANIDANDIVGSQPQIQNAIEQLEKLTSQDGIKKAFCSSLCSE